MQPEPNKANAFLVEGKERLSREKFYGLALKLAVLLKKESALENCLRVGFWGRGNVISLATLAALYRLGKTVCFFSLREPSAVIEQWIKRLGLGAIFLGAEQVVQLGKKPPAVKCYSWETLKEALKKAAGGGAIEGGGRGFRATEKISEGVVFFSSGLKKEGAALATLLFTSGSTGAPKLSAFTFKQHWEAAKLQNKANGFTASGMWLLNLPLNHVSGLSIVFRSWVSGGGISLLPKPSGARKKRGTAVAELQAVVKRDKISHLSLVPTQLLQYLAAAREVAGGEAALKQTLGHLRCLLLGGAPLLDWVWNFAAALPPNFPLQPTYGLTETLSQLATQPGLRSSSGAKEAKREQYQLLSGRTVRVKDGVLWVKKTSLGIFSGYVVLSAGKQLEKKEALVLSKEGGDWFPTGDLVERRGDWLRVLGRRDNRFISGGENVQAEEVEQALLSSGVIASALVYGVTNKKWGAVPVAVVGFNRRSSFTKSVTWSIEIKKIQAFLRGRLAKYKHPVHYYLWPKLRKQNGNLTDKRKRRWIEKELRSKALQKIA